MQPERTSIGELAYRIWQSRGCPEGTAEQDWLDAEKQLRSAREQSARAIERRAAEPTSSNAIDRSSQESFPASDPPANHQPDVPPTNAEAKWKAAKAAQAADPSRASSPVARSRRSKPAQGKPTAEPPG
jgi:hypothetical protein